MLTQIQLLFFSALAFVWLKLTGIYPPELISTNLDADWLYRKLVPTFLKNGNALYRRICTPIRQALHRSGDVLIGLTQRWYGENSSLGGVQTVGATIAIALLLFAIILVWDLLAT